MVLHANMVFMPYKQTDITYKDLLGSKVWKISSPNLVKTETLVFDADNESQRVGNKQITRAGFCASHLVIDISTCPRCCCCCYRSLSSSTARTRRMEPGVQDGENQPLPATRSIWRQEGSQRQAEILFKHMRARRVACVETCLLAIWQASGKVISDLGNLFMFKSGVWLSSNTSEALSTSPVLPGILERAPFEFDEDLAADDFLSAVRVPPPAFAPGFWGCRA
ncbi:hypothetical protein V1504DRAFT_458815 [Lipomyces starkeyi]